jgi:3-oxoacid CoA-transferase A subunit
MKRVLSAEEAIAECVFDGATLMVGGFGLVGKPLTLVRALNQSAVKDLTIISNNLGEPGKGLGETLRLGKVRRAIGSYFTTNPDVGAAVLAGKLQVTLIPQGTMSEAMRAAGAGLGGFYTPTAAGTKLAEGKETGCCADANTCWKSRSRPTWRSSVRIEPIGWATSSTGSRRAISIR